MFHHQMQNRSVQSAVGSFSAVPPNTPSPTGNINNNDNDDDDGDDYSSSNSNSYHNRHHNVDICITCVTDKPPQLPLREELPSLGIEVVYNAHGIGQKASREQAKQMIAQFRQDTQMRDMKKRRLWPKSDARIQQRLEQRQSQEEQLKLPKACSYETYEHLLAKSMSGDELHGQEIEEEGEEEEIRDEAANENSNTGHTLLLAPAGWDTPTTTTTTTGSVGAAHPPQAPPNTPSPVLSNEKQSSKKKSPAVGVGGGFMKSVLQAFSSESHTHESESGETGEDDELGDDEEEDETTSYDRSGGEDDDYINEDHDRSGEDEEDQKTRSSNSNSHNSSNSFQAGQSARHLKILPSAPSTPAGSTSHDPSSSNATSRDPSSISTKDNNNNNSPLNNHDNGQATKSVHVMTDPTARKYLPELQPVPSVSSSSSSSANASSHTSNNTQKQDPPTHDTNNNSSSGNSRADTAAASSAAADFTDPQLNEAFAAFRLTDHKSKDTMDSIYDSLGPPANKAAKREHHHHPANNIVAPPFSNNNNNKNDNTVASNNWMDTAKMAFAEVYKQATGSSNTPSGHGTVTNGLPPPPPQQLLLQQQQLSLLSPTSTLSSLPSSKQQQQPQMFFTKLPNSPASSSSQSPPETSHPSASFIINQPHVEVHVRPDGAQLMVPSSIGAKSVTAFLEALQQPKVPVDSIQRMLRVCPGLAKVKPQTQQSQGRLGLHVACARAFPKHEHKISTSLATALVDDIQQLKRLIHVLVDANRGACCVLDHNGDLPAHLLARNLMEWEAQWYEKVYEKVQQEDGGHNAAAITKLYQTMSHCIETVLHPLAVFCHASTTATTPTTTTEHDGNPNSNNRAAQNTLCRAPGSIGLLLPLHIASIFTASVPTIRRLLEQDPTAATVKCNLGRLQTFIPDRSLPLELHDKLSTDFPKWEIGAEARKSKTVQGTNGEIIMLEDYMRRSDLLFAFHPTVDRYRFEKQRIARLETKIIAEAKQMAREEGENNDAEPSNGNGHLSVAVKRIWIWMCTFQDGAEMEAPFFSNVERILDTIPESTVPYMANIKTPQGKILSQVAAPECQSLLRSRLQAYEKTQASKLEEMVAHAVASASPSSAKASGDGSSYGGTCTSATTNNSACLSLKGKGYVGVLCRTLFNVSEDSLPTSFILLPYKLTKNEHGKLGIDKKSSASTAVKFAECLLKLTDPKTILYYLEQKSLQYSDQRISSDSDDESSFRAKTQNNFKEIEDSLVSLYEEGGKGYLYLIDELIGLPIVPANPASLYPIELTSPEMIVRKVLPLMLTGMILMRGEKALSVLVNVLLDKSVKHVSSNWVDAAREIIAYLFSQQDNRSDDSLPGLDALVDELRAFVSSNSSVKSSSSDGIHTKEWEIELSILRMVVQMNDNMHSFAGLKAKRDEPGTVLWTKHRIEEEQIQSDASKSMADSSKRLATNYSDPPGTTMKGAANLASQDGSSKFSSSKDGISSISETKQSEDDVSAAISSLMSRNSKKNYPSLRGKRDIEKLRMQSTVVDSTSVSADPEGDYETNLNLVQNDSNIDGEELAGVKILLDAEDGPSLLDQEDTCSTDDDASDDQAKDKYKSVFSTDDTSENDNASSSTDADKEVYVSSEGHFSDNDSKRKASEPLETTRSRDTPSLGSAGIHQRKRSKDTSFDSSDDEVLKYDFADAKEPKISFQSVHSAGSESHGRGSIQISQNSFDIESRQDQYSYASAEFSVGDRSQGRSYNEGQIEEISHPEKKTKRSPERNYELEMEKLNDYTIGRLSCSPFGELNLTSPIQSSPSLSSNFSSRSNNQAQIYPAKAITESRDSERDVHQRPSGRENVPLKNMSFVDMREQLTDQALKIDCLGSTLESIKIREDKLLSRGQMLQEFLRDLVDQSENMQLDSEKRVKQVQNRLTNLEERVLHNEIEAQHIAFNTFLLEDEVESIAEEEYKRELCYIIEARSRKRSGLEDAIGRSATIERIRAGQWDDNEISTVTGFDSLYALDGYSNPEDVISDRSMQRFSPYEERIPPRAVDMNNLLRNASHDERSIEYEMGLAMFGTLGDADKFRANSLDVYERMRSDFHHSSTVTPPPALTLTQDDSSENGYSSAGDFVDVNSIEGDGLDWVKMSARQFDIPQSLRQQ